MSSFKGIIPAVVTPMNEDGSLNLSKVESVVKHLVDDGVDGFYVCGSNGEGPNLTVKERKQVAKAFVKEAPPHIDVIIHVGHNSLRAAGDLASHAESIGADAIAAVPPSYYGELSEEIIADSLSKVATATPGLPFFYYHVPALNGMNINVPKLMKLMGKRIAGFEGVKFSSTKISEFIKCKSLGNDDYTVLFGVDEMLLSALAAGAEGFVGSTYNFATPLYKKIIENFEKRNLELAQKNQLKAIKMVQVLQKYKGYPAFKEIMRLLGVNCGPTRLPIKPLNENKRENLESELRELGYFQWGR